MPMVCALALDDLWDGEMKRVEISGKKILVVRVGDVVHAYADRCAHLGVPLSEGKLEGCVLTCSAHHYTYDVRTGEGINPKRVQLPVFPVRIEDGRIWVDVE
jgi:toluene monooxygenase system ferredoxin subunit